MINSYSILIAILNVACSQDVNVWTTDARRTSSDSAYLKLNDRLHFGLDQSTSEYVIDVDEHATYQNVEGFGITLSDSSAWLLWRMSARRREEFIKSVFDRQVGIGLNVVRITIGASEFSLTNYTYADTCCHLSDFSISHDRQYIIPILKLIRRMNPDVIILGILWSPPAWMKTTGSIVGGKLKKEEQSNFATYLAKFVQEYNKEGLQIYGIVIQNEPIHESCCYPSMFMDAREQAYIVKTKLGPIFRKYKFSTKIFIYGQDWEKIEYPLDVLGDAEARNYISGTAFTCYGGTAENQRKLHTMYHEKDIWLVECGDGLWNDGGKFETLFKHSLKNDIVEPLRNYATGVLKRNLLLNKDNGPFNAGCSECLGLATLNEKTGQLTYNSAYYSFGHASKFVRSGAKRIQSTTFTEDIDSVAFLNSDNTKILVVINHGNTTKLFKVKWGVMSFPYTLQASNAVTFIWKGKQLFRPAYERIEGESHSDYTGTVQERCLDVSGCGDNVAHITSSDYLQYRELDFGETGISSIAIRYASKSSKTGLVEVRLDALDGKFLGLLQLKSTSGWQNWRTITDRVQTVTGIRDLYFVFRGGDPDIGNINWFAFNPTPGRTATETMVLNENAAYKIVAMKNNQVLGVPKGSTTSGTSIQLSDFQNSDQQKFLFRSIGNGCYKIGVKHTYGLSISYDQSYGDSEGARVVQATDSNGPNQKWRLLPATDGYWQIASCENNLLWDVTNNEKDSLVHIHTVSPQREQRFTVAMIEIFPGSKNISEEFWRRE